MNTWSRFARQKEERTSSALIAAALHSAPAELPADFCRQVCRVREAGWWLVRARNTTTNNSTTAHGSTRSALLALLCGFSPALLLPRRPIRRSYALHRPASFAPRCAATSLLLRSCTVALTIKGRNAPRPVSLTRELKGHTPFIRPVFATASAAFAITTKQAVRLGLSQSYVRVQS